MKHRLVHLDFIRGVAAFLVVISYLNGFVFLPFHKHTSSGLIERLWFFAATLGHQAVIVFFVLSGFLVGGSVIRLFQANRFSWDDYLLRRVTRLWTVLIPALLLTLFWDTFGAHKNPAGYNGLFFDTYGSGLQQSSPADHTLSGFLGNISFLQTILVPVYGSNRPLWSISNEFWYYLIFPIVLGIFAKSTIRNRSIYFLAAVLLVAFLPREMLLLGLSWALGAAVFYWLQNERILKAAIQPVFLIVSIILALLILLLSRLGKLGALFDISIAIAITPLIAALAVRSAKTGIYTRMSAAASEFSYTLYLVHFPLMAFVFYSFFPGRQFPLGLNGVVVFLGVMVITIVYAALIWWCFERNTDRLRSLIRSKILDFRETSHPPFASVNKLATLQYKQDP